MTEALDYHRAAFGPSPERPDARAKVTGRARYTGDLHVPGMVEGAVLRSPWPHARILSIDTAEAERQLGVLAVLTAADLGGIDPYFGQALRDQPVLAIDRVRFAGEPVAAVAAVDARAAEAALRRIVVHYEPLPALRSVDEALAPGAPALHDRAPRSTLFPDVRDITPDLARNLAHHFVFRRGDPEAAFREADRVFDDTFTLPSVHHHPLEPHGAIAHHLGSELTVWAGTQYPFATRQMLAEMFGLPQSRVRVIVPFVGGAFGSRELLPVIPLATALSRKARAPVRILCSAEDTARTVARDAARIRIQSAVRGDGTLLGRKAEIHLDVGAYANQGPRLCKKAGYRVIGPYRIPHVQVDSYAVYTNHVSAGAYRGFGAPEVCWAYESQMDREAVPSISRVAVLWDSSVHEGLSVTEQRSVAARLGIALLPIDVKTLDELTAALTTVARERADGLFVFPNFINGKHRRLILDFAATHRLPTMFQATEAVAAGGLMSY